MRLWLSVLGFFLAFLYPSNFVAADPPLLPENAGSTWTPPSIPVVQPLPAAPIEPTRAVGPQPVETEVILGLPTEFRIQWATLRGTNLAFMLEGIAGVVVIPLVDFGAIGFGVLGAGVRLCSAVYNGERNAFVLKPGVDVYEFVTGSRAGGPLGGADVELLWWHNCGSGNRFGFQLGADVGAFFVTGGGSWGWFPMAGGIFGLHF